MYHSRLGGLLAALCAMLILAACSSASPDHGTAPGAPTPQLAGLPALSALDGLPKPPRGTSAVLTRTGDLLSTSGGAVEIAGTVASFGSEQGTYSWAVFSFDIAANTTISSLTLDYVGDNTPFYVGVSDYGAGAWHFFKLTSPAASQSLSSLASLVSPAGSCYVALVEADGGDMSLNSISLNVVAPVLPDWIHTYGRENNVFQIFGEWINGMTLDGLGNIYAIARCYPENGSFTTLDRDAMLLKYGTDGTLAFAKVYHDTDTLYPTDLLVDKDSNVVVAGGNWAAKFDSSGAVVWSKRYDSLNIESPEIQQLATDSTGAIYAAGFSDDWGHGFVLKLNGDGSKAWAKRWTIANELGDIEYPQVSLALSNGTLFLADHEVVSGNFHNLLHVVDSDGNLLAVKSWQNGFEYADNSSALAPLPGGGVLFSGQDSGFESDVFYTATELLWFNDTPAVTKSAGLRIHNSNGYSEYQSGLALDPGGEVFILDSRGEQDTRAGLRLLHCGSSGEPLGAFELTDGSGDYAPFANGVAHGLLSATGGGLFIGGRGNDIGGAQFLPMPLESFSIAPVLSDQVRPLTDVDLTPSDLTTATLTEGAAEGALPDRTGGNYDALLLRVQF